MSDDQDEATLKELNETRERRERLGVDTDDLDEEREQKENRQELLARRARFSEALQGDSLPPATREAYKNEISEIDEVLVAPIKEEAEDKRAQVEKLRRNANSADQMSHGEHMASSLREQADEIEAEAEELEQKLSGESSETDTQAELGADADVFDGDFSTALESLKEDLATHRDKTAEFGREVEAEAEATAELRAALESHE